MTFPALQTEGRTQPPPALGQETGSSAGSRWSPLHSPCAKVWGGASWPCAPPWPQTAWEERRRRRKAGHGCPAQVRGETVRQAAEPVPWGCGSIPDPLRRAALWKWLGGNHLPGDRASIQQPGQAPCLNFSNPILRLCAKLSIKKKSTKRWLFSFACRPWEETCSWTDTTSCWTPDRFTKCSEACVTCWKSKLLGYL